MAKDRFRHEEVKNDNENVEAGLGGLSDDGSSFYGNEELKASFVGRAASYEPKRYWDVTQWNIQCIAAQAASPVLEEASNAEVLTGNSARPYNPFEGDVMAKQLSESLDDFLARLKPSETSVGDGGPWIWVANPQSSHRPTNEDIAGFKEAGSRALSHYLAQKNVYEQQHPGKVQSSITRMLRGDRDHLETSIMDLARQHRVMCGKWMLFPTPEQVDAVWSVVAKATIDDQLGCAAKVATNDEDPNSRVRLVHIYTYDFSDLQDVKRVLQQIQSLGLLKGSKGDLLSIFYKCDAYTHLDIHSNNEYKLKASMYSSKELLSSV